MALEHANPHKNNRFMESQRCHEPRRHPVQPLIQNSRLVCSISIKCSVQPGLCPTSKGELTLSQGSQFYDRVSRTLRKFFLVLSPYLPSYISWSPRATQNMPSHYVVWSIWNHTSRPNSLSSSNCSSRTWVPSPSSTSSLPCRHAPVWPQCIGPRTGHIFQRSEKRKTDLFHLVSLPLLIHPKFTVAFRVAILLSAFSHSLEGLSLLGMSAYHSGVMEHGLWLAGYTCVTLGEVSPAVWTCFLICELRIIKVPTSYGCHGK